ncbi:MAG TPA: alpha/beta fold hydrolase [Methylophilaceae bacterium]|nr:alpha/beta fold hydrolase [Methylophilaceae bacterium]
MTLLETLEIATGNNITASVIWLHGLGANGHDFVPVVEQLKLPNIRFILPHAPQRPVSINGGYVMPAWYDLFGLEIDSPQDETGIRATQQSIKALITQERQRGIAAERIILAGFSQGGAIALHTALRYPQRLAGVLALSTYLPLKPLLATEKSVANAGLPIFIGHGTFDTVISPEVCQISANLLSKHGYAVEWHQYAMAHSVCMEEVDDIRDFLIRVLA